MNVDHVVGNVLMRNQDPEQLVSSFHALLWCAELLAGSAGDRPAFTHPFPLNKRRYMVLAVSMAVVISI
jgi:hypothetical protein